jgi:hypothetical protein
MSEAMKPQGATAKYVLGQLDLISITPGLPGDVGMSVPTFMSITSDGTLFISDQLANRVLSFSNMPQTANGMKATGVWGQPDFISIAIGVALDNFNTPLGLTYDSPTNSLWIADRGNSRILVFDNAVFKSNVSSSVQVNIQFDGQTPTVVLAPLGKF